MVGWAKTNQCIQLFKKKKEKRKKLKRSWTHQTTKRIASGSATETNFLEKKHTQTKLNYRAVMY